MSRFPGTDEGVRGSTVVAADEPPVVVGGGRYRIVRFLGRGAFKQVFLGVDSELEREVAISFVAHIGGDGWIERHRREVRAMARLGDHPHIVAVHDVGAERDLTFIVSQYVPGGSLAARLHDQPERQLAVADAVAAARDVSAALAHAHAHGLIHRDVKPSNVLLGEHDDAMLTDFGMALSLDQARLTAEHAFVGTAAYVAPEQARGADVDARSDFYALGVMLYELLTGELPFGGGSMFAVLAQHATAPRPRPSDRNPGVPAALDAVVARLMAVNPDDRYASAEEIRDDLAAVRPGAGAPRRRRPAARFPLPPALATVRQSPFVGREAVMDTLRGAWAAATGGTSGVVFVRGNAGIGKTRLCRELAHEVHAGGGAVIYGRCEEEALAPYAPFTEALRHYAAHGPALPLSLDLPAGVELARLGWPVPGARPRSPADGEGVERYLVFEGAVALVAAMAQAAPLLAIFDDLHWADVPTLRMIRHLVRHVGMARVLLVCTLRDDEPSRDARRERAIEDMRREPAVLTLDLDGLSDEDTAALVAARGHGAGATSVIGRLRDRTEGNPFYIEETLHGLRTPADLRDALSDAAHIPRGIQALILRRLSGLSPDAHEVLGAASVIGREFGLGMLSGVLGRDRVADALDEPVRDGIVVWVPGHLDRFAFRHALVRETLYDELAPSVRAALHARCGEVLEARFGTSEGHAAELAHHFWMARPLGYREQALRYSLAAARYASDRYAYEEAVEHKDAALAILREAEPPREPERCDLLMSRGRSQWRAGESRDAQASFREAAALARSLGDAERFAAAALGFGRRYYDPGKTQDEWVTLLEEAHDRIGSGDSGTRARVLAGLSQALQFRGPPAHVQALGREAVAIARRLRDDEALIVALTSLHNALLHAEFLLERLPISAELLRLVERGAPGEYGATALNWRVYDLFEQGDMDAARRAHARLSELADRLRQPLYLHFAAAWDAKWAEIAGRFEEAEALARRSLSFARRANMPYAASNYYGQLFGLRRDQGLLDTLPREVAEQLGDQQQLGVWRAGIVLARLDGDQREHAERDFDALARDNFDAIPPDLFWLGAMCLLAEACARLGDAARAPVLYARLAPHAERNAQIGLAVSVGTVHRFLGLLSAVTERWPDAEVHFEAALERSSAMGATASLAHIRCDYAEMLLARGEAGDDMRAAAHLESARAVAGELRIKPVTDRAAALQRRLG
jgi:hypothetical protein